MRAGGPCRSALLLPACAAAQIQHVYPPGPLSCDNTPPCMPCEIDCRGREECRGETIECPDDCDCLLICQGERACARVELWCPTTGTCTIAARGNNVVNQISVLGGGTPDCYGTTAVCNKVEAGMGGGGGGPFGGGGRGGRGGGRGRGGGGGGGGGGGPSIRKGPFNARPVWTDAPTIQPFPLPTWAPENPPTWMPTFSEPTWSPVRPSARPSAPPSAAPSQRPSPAPTLRPQAGPSLRPSIAPSPNPQAAPSQRPSLAPTLSPQAAPSQRPSSPPSSPPVLGPSAAPTAQPTAAPSTPWPSAAPTTDPTQNPLVGTRAPARPTVAPSALPSLRPSPGPSQTPTASPSQGPSQPPTALPTWAPSLRPSLPPIGAPSPAPSARPSERPSALPSATPSLRPSPAPSAAPSPAPSGIPRAPPSGAPTLPPTAAPSAAPSSPPSAAPSGVPRIGPSGAPSAAPSASPSSSPSGAPSAAPSATPSGIPTGVPSSGPSLLPSAAPSPAPSAPPSPAPSGLPTHHPSPHPSGVPSVSPSGTPSRSPSAAPSGVPSVSPSGTPSRAPSATPSGVPSRRPTQRPSRPPTAQPSVPPSLPPSAQPSARPSPGPSASPTAQPTAAPRGPTAAPSAGPSSPPTAAPSGGPSRPPSRRPSRSPAPAPSRGPSGSPSGSPSGPPRHPPSASPSALPSRRPSRLPSAAPREPPTVAPSAPPRPRPTAAPTAAPSGTTCPAGQVGWPKCRNCSIASDCNGLAHAVTADAATDSCICHCLRRRDRYGADIELADSPIFAGSNCQECAEGFTGFPLCTGCSVEGNCSGGAADAAIDPAGGCKCICQPAYGGDRCSRCAPGHQPSPVGCVGSRSLAVAPEAVEGEAIATTGVTVVIRVSGDTFSSRAVSEWGIEGSPTVLYSSSKGKEELGMQHAFTASLEAHVRNGTQNESLVFLRPALGCEKVCAAHAELHVKLGPLPTFAADHQERITITFQPRAFSSARRGWFWKHQTVHFDIRRHKRVFAGAASVKAALNSGGAVALTAAAPTGAGKLALVMELADCPSQEVPGAEGVEELGFMGNPTALGIGSGKTSANLGASVGNTLLVFPLISLTHILVVLFVWQVRKRWKAKASFYGAMGVCMFPCWQLLPALLFYQGTLEGAIRVLYYGETWQQLTVGPIIAIIMAAPVLVVRRLTRRPTLKAVVVPCPTANPIRRILLGDQAWESQSDKTWIERWGMFFWDYREQYKMFLLFEVGGIQVLSWAGAWHPNNRPQCIAKISIIATVFLVSIIVVGKTRPYIAQYDNGMFLLMTSFEFTAVVCALSMTIKGPDAKGQTGTEEGIAGACMQAALFGLIFKTVVDFSCWVFERLESIFCKKHDSGKDSNYVSMVSADDLQGECSQVCLTMTDVAQPVPARPATPTDVKVCPVPGCAKMCHTAGALDRHMKGTHLCRKCNGLYNNRIARDKHSQTCLGARSPSARRFSTGRRGSRPPALFEASSLEDSSQERSVRGSMGIRSPLQDPPRRFSAAGSESWRRASRDGRRRSCSLRGEHSPSDTELDLLALSATPRGATRGRGRDTFRRPTFDSSMRGIVGGSGTGGGSPRANFSQSRSGKPSSPLHRTTRLGRSGRRPRQVSEGHDRRASEPDADYGIPGSPLGAEGGVTQTFSGPAVTRGRL